MAQDPYKYFRIEARELLDGLSRGVLDLETGLGLADVLARILRQAHTLKGASRVVKQPRISELSHAIEEVLAPYRQGAQPLPRERINHLLGLLDEIAACLGLLDAPSQQLLVPAGDGQIDIPPAAVEDGFDTVRIDVDDMDAFLYEIAEAGVHVAALRQQAAGLERSLSLATALYERMAVANGRQGGAADRAVSMAEELRSSLRRTQRTLISGIEKAQREISKAQDRAGNLRLLPARAIFPLLERVTRDAADALGRRVDLQAVGGEQRLDAHVLRALRDALGQIVRNAVAHGIEPEATRLAGGKPAVGRVELRVERRGNRIVFTCSDDGRGIDVAEVRRVAVEHGLATVAEAAAWDADKAIACLMGTGLSTKRQVTEVSGRGIGLELARDTVARLKGQLVIHSERSRGTTVQISVPLLLESLAVLEVDAGGMIVSIPFDAVRQTARLRSSEIATSPRGASILFEGQTIPFLPLVRLLRPQDAVASASRSVWSAIILQAGPALAAVGVDHLLRQTSVMMRPLPRIIGKMPALTGASFDSEGNPQLLLDPTGVIEAVAEAQTLSPGPASPAKVPVLVVDDSLTTRMLEQSILETAGYDVSVAVSGEEAMEKAAQRRFAIFVVDVEMPGMGGFEFIRRAQADPQLQGIPSILVTSRASLEDRLRGQRAGARAYIVKSEFDEGQLLRTIRTLIG